MARNITDPGSNSEVTSSHYVNVVAADEKTGSFETHHVDNKLISELSVGEFKSLMAFQFADVVSGIARGVVMADRVRRLSYEVGVREKLAACLRAKNVKFFGSCHCPRCKEQVRLLGSEFLKGIYVETVSDCPNYDENWGQGLPSGSYMLPIWKFPDGTVSQGEILPYEELSVRAGCPY